MIRTIRAKFILGFFVIFFLSFLLLNLTVSHVIRTNNEKIVTDDLIGLKKNSNVYVRQAFLINHFTNNDLYFGQMAEEMVADLNHATSSEVSAYTTDGVLLYASSNEDFSKSKDDLKQALQGKTAFTISSGHGKASVLFSYPVVIDGTKVGILRFAKDVTLLYEQSGRILNIVSYLALAIFATAFVFSYMLSRNITIPLVKLTRASTEVMNGNLDVSISFKKRRRDEIGRLSRNFNNMISRIKDQIARIERDRDRLEELNVQRKKFFDNVTHELKTPLTSILGYAEMLREDRDSDPEFFDKGMNHIMKESQRLHGMVLKLLERSRETVHSGEFAVVEAGRILQDVCESMAFKAKRYNKIIRCSVENELTVFGNGDKLRQLFINLLDNAIKYGYAHSEISATGSHDLEVIRFTFVNEGKTIATGHLAKIFEPFYLADQPRKEAGSVGLGLGIAKTIVDSHRGTIRMISENEQTTVIVEIPYMKVREVT